MKIPKQHAPVTVCLDPGLRHSGAAIFLRRELVAVRLASNPDGRGPGAWMKVAVPVHDLYYDDKDGPLTGFDFDFVAEKMVSYPGSPVKVDDLMELVGVVGAVVGGLPKAESYTYYTPREWKKQVPKKIHNNRTLAVLSPAEKSLLVDIPKAELNNVLDAVGLGLFYLGRTT